MGERDALRARVCVCVRVCFLCDARSFGDMTLATHVILTIWAIFSAQGPPGSLQVQVPDPGWPIQCDARSLGDMTLATHA